jgi:tripartite-type tricarboxylate transporter receptor subunit TctC
VRIIVGFPPGGPTDIFARLIGDWLTKRLGQPFVIENRPGAGSTIGVATVVTAPADGYTLLLISTSAVISASYYHNLSFNLVRDIAPVCGVALEPMVMVVNPSVPAKTVAEFVANAKAEPGRQFVIAVDERTIGRTCIHRQRQNARRRERHRHYKLATTAKRLIL